MKRTRSGSIGSEPGNTKPAQSKRGAPSKHWCFTLNNPDGSMVPLLLEKFKNTKYVFQEETGEQGTPHLQGYVEFPNKVRAIQHIGIPQIHWEKTRDIKGSIAYCSKPDTRTGNIYTNLPLPVAVKDPLEDKELFEWQKKVIDIISEAPDDRSVHWFWEETGCRGKTTLCKHLALKKGALVLGGKAADIKHAIADYVSSVKQPDIVLLHFTRTTEEFVSYDAIEAVKDGIFFSGKYESRQVIYNCPHVICFANFPPEESKLSRDRWHIYKIE